MGIESEINTRNNTQRGVDIVVNNFNEEIHARINDGNGTGEETNRNDTSSITNIDKKATGATATNTSTKSVSNINISNENSSTNQNNDIVSNHKIIDTITNVNCIKDELVLDILNDDLIEKVRGKISCKLHAISLLVDHSLQHNIEYA